MSFDSEVDAAIARIEEDATTAVRNRVTDVMHGIVYYNGQRAFDTGLLVNSWEASINEPFTNEEGNGAVNDRSGPESVRRIQQIYKKINLGNKVYFTNSIPYGTDNELGTEKIRPRRFLGQAVQEGGKDIK